MFASRKAVTLASLIAVLSMAATGCAVAPPEVERSPQEIAVARQQQARIEAEQARVARVEARKAVVAEAVENKTAVALTYDDGAGPRTPELLELLERENVPATFFVLNVANDPNGVAALKKAFVGTDGGAEEGGWSVEIAGHSVKHPVHVKLSDEALAAQIDGSSEYVSELRGGEASDFYRYPYGSRNAHTDAALATRGLTSVLWACDSNDWRSRNVGKIVADIDSCADKTVILAHDIHDATIDSAQTVITNLKAQGKVFVTIPELHEAAPDTLAFKMTNATDNEQENGND